MHERRGNRPAEMSEQTHRELVGAAEIALELSGPNVTHRHLSMSTSRPAYNLVHFDQAFDQAFAQDYRGAYHDELPQFDEVYLRQAFNEADGTVIEYEVDCKARAGRTIHAHFGPFGSEVASEYVENPMPHNYTCDSLERQSELDEPEGLEVLGVLEALIKLNRLKQGLGQ